MYTNLNICIKISARLSLIVYYLIADRHTSIVPSIAEHIQNTKKNSELELGTRNSELRTRNSELRDKNTYFVRFLKTPEIIRNKKKKKKKKSVFKSEFPEFLSSRSSRSSEFPRSEFGVFRSSEFRSSEFGVPSSEFFIPFTHSFNQLIILSHTKYTINIKWLFWLNRFQSFQSQMPTTDSSFN